MANSPGVRVLAHLVANPDKQLRGSALLPLLKSGAEGLDAAANGRAKSTPKGAYRRRFNLLRTELRRARQRNDSLAVRKLEHELQTVTRELARAIGLAQDRPGTAVDRRVADAIASGIAAVAKCDRGLGDYLHRRVRIGRTFSYTPKEL